MKIRRLQELNDAIDAELGWRRRELDHLRDVIRSSKSHHVDAVLRAGIVMLYAHWEGFVKQSVESYMEFVSRKKMRISELNDSFAAMSLRIKLNEFAQTNKPCLHNQFMRYVRNGLNDIAPLVDRPEVRTNSNLKSHVLKEILCQVDIDYSFFELKEKRLNTSLVDARNSIAHGRDLLTTISDFDSLLSDVISWMEYIRTQIQNSAVTSKYRVQTVAAKVVTNRKRA